MSNLKNVQVGQVVAISGGRHRYAKWSFAKVVAKTSRTLTLESGVKYSISTGHRWGSSWGGNYLSTNLEYAKERNEAIDLQIIADDEAEMEAEQEAQKFQIRLNEVNTKPLQEKLSELLRFDVPEVKFITDVLHTEIRPIMENIQVPDQHLGIMAGIVSSAAINTWGNYYNTNEDRMFFTVHISYNHHNGGSNSSEIMEAEYSFKENAWTFYRRGVDKNPVTVAA